MERCIFRDLRRSCSQCFKECANRSCFCQKHLNTKNTVFKYIMLVTNAAELEIDSKIVIDIYKEIYKHEASIDKRVMMLKSILGNKKRITPITESFGIKNSRKILKKELISYIFNRLEWFNLVLSLTSTSRKICKIQRLWREYIRTLSGEIYGQPCNNEDIFTFEYAIDIKHPFYIKDAGICYVFEPAYLYEFFKREGYWNPYTRNEISPLDFVRLSRFILIKAISKEIFPTYTWDTVEKAYTDVVIEFERLGFLTQVEWFLSLRFNHIIKILNKFHQYTFMMQNNNYLIEDTFDNVYPQYIYTFCRMMLEMMKDKSNPDIFTFVCLLYKSLIDCNTRFRENAPDWILDISIVNITLMI